MTDLLIAGDSLTQLLNWTQPLFAAEPTLLESWGTFLYNIMLVALGLGFVIFVHELGHFLAAKTFGVQCDKFYVGFDPPLQIGPIKLPSKLFHFQWGETEYGIGVIPLGGYVKMLGQDDDPRNSAAEAARSREGVGPDGAPKLNPRSYAAKSVYARMVIISAGVVMNLITGVFMAAIAFYVGVPYDAAVIGTVFPGDPAWHAGLEPGDRFVKVNKNENDELSFRDMQQSIVFAGLRDASKPVAIGVDRNGETKEFSVVGTTHHSDPSRGIQILSLGMRSTFITTLSRISPISKQYTEDPSYEASSLPRLEPGDIVVGINGETLPVSRYAPEPLGYELDKRLEPRHAETVTLNVMRLKNPDDKKSEEREPVDVPSPPVAMKSFGAGFLPTPVVTVRENSLGFQSGIEEGMKLISLDGEPIDDAFALLLKLSSKFGKKATLDFTDAAGEKKTFEWQLPDSFPVPVADAMFGPTGLEIPGTGIVYGVSNIVGRIEPGMPAEKAGLQVNDVITQIRFSPETEDELQYFKNVLLGAESLKKAQLVDRGRNMQYWIGTLQMMRTGLSTELHFERDGKVDRCNVTVAKHPTLHWPDRGLQFTSLKRTHQVDSVADAMGLGLHEIVRRGGNVLEFLELLVRGKLPFRAVGGPGAIAMEATDAASRGISPLLMFLTLLSANLAIINFLPIPALDGGHMVFLIAEAIRGKPVDEELEGKLRLAGVLGLLCLMLAVVFNDYINISRFYRG
ncbi:Putative zinc metalloprotease [Pirellula sp. SH-Sr6A]|uniref:site-2 protease family protein n=1 Tax=Pirellula sp. SH-Sr6A TaxID=1632865 RepID=UPI00078EB077|nr:site-2 protease family protein [Pirellula sp. SH-Sr6A]AMV34757.1 Putative zinc metalloprotease [Pirellula sp. SH-Sr6A]